MQKQIILTLAILITLLASCSKYKAAPPIQKVYSGMLVNNTGSVNGKPQNNWDTVRNYQLTVTQLPNIKAVVVGFFGVSPGDTLLQDTTGNNGPTTATAHYYLNASNGSSGEIYYLYYYAANDSIVGEYFAEPCCGVIDHHWIYGKH